MKPAAKTRTFRLLKRPPPSTPDLITDQGVDDIDEGGETVNIDGTITSYGADYPVDGLVKRIEQGDIVIPTFDPEVNGGSAIRGFQRKLVWTRRQADRFIESLLLGFPVPGIFLVKQPDGILLVLDGAQRLRTLQSFFKDSFRGQPFQLKEVQDRWRDRGYLQLDPSDRRRLDNSIIHATVVKQDDEADNHEAVYLIFERLNTGGTLLQPQEIRVALYSGAFVDLLRSLNDGEAWRKLFGKRSPHLKDQELILRILAMLDRRDKYKRPMKEFLNEFMKANRSVAARKRNTVQDTFNKTAEHVLEHIGSRAFRLKTTINAAVAESIMVGVATGIERQALLAPAKLRHAFDRLVATPAFVAAVTKSTADEENVRSRLEMAIHAFRRG